MSAAPGRSLLRSLRAVAWSFLGIRGRGASQQDMATIKPLHVIVVGLVGALLLVVGLIVLARSVTGG
ncbi:MAG: DUF2970 domain-containing protein [Rhodoferax sp.]|nr:DUF2970 domain-containing protein [Rhodoferax sp.]